MKVSNDRGTQTVDVEFEISHRDTGEISVGVERIDIRREKKYGVRLSVGSKVETKDWPLCQTLCGFMTHKLRAKGFAATGYAPGVGASFFIAAESPSKILDSSAPEARETIAKMIAALEQAFKDAVAEHEKNVAAEVDVYTAQRIAGWVAGKLEEEAERAIDYEARLKALKDEREAKLREIMARDHEAFVRSSVNVEGSVSATERAIKTALANIERYVDYQPRTNFFGNRDDLTPEDLVGE